MRPILLTLLLFIGLQTYSQTEFAPAGAHWEYYRAGSMMDPYNPIISNSVTYIGDTIIENLQAKELLVHRSYSSHTGGFNTSSWSQFVTQSNDSVFYWVDDTWDFVFDFDVVEGDKRLVYVGYPQGLGCIAHDTMLVDSVWSYEYSGVQLKAIEYHILMDEWSAFNEPVRHSYIERIGFVSNYPTVPHWCQNQIPDHAFPSFYCYHDEEMLNSGGATCSLSVGVEDELNKQEVELQVRYAQAHITNAHNSTLYIYNLHGKELVQKRITSDNQVVDLSHLSNGILMVVVETEDGRLTKKVVKATN